MAATNVEVLTLITDSRAARASHWNSDDTINGCTGSWGLYDADDDFCITEHIYSPLVVVLITATCCNTIITRRAFIYNAGQ